MKIYQACTIGQFHTNHCEDYAVSVELGRNKWLCAVLDGCTMGNESYFAATLTGKILKKIATERNYLEFTTKVDMPLRQELREILQSLFAELSFINNLLLLGKHDLLTTLIIFIFDDQRKQGEILVIGDGVVCLNGQVIEYDHDNMPDYLGYHLQEDFDTWFDKQNQNISIDTLTDISICTDGIFTFSPVATKKYENTINPLEYLLLDKTFAANENMLTRKLLHLENNCGLKPTDDLAIVRLIG